MQLGLDVPQVLTVGEKAGEPDKTTTSRPLKKMNGKVSRPPGEQDSIPSGPGRGVANASVPEAFGSADSCALAAISAGHGFSEVSR